MSRQSPVRHLVASGLEDESLLGPGWHVSVATEQFCKGSTWVPAESCKFFFNEAKVQGS